MVQLSHPYMTTGKIIALTKWPLVRKLMSLRLNILSRFVIASLPRSKRLLNLWLQSPSAVIWEPKKIVCYCFHCFPIYLLWSNETGCQDLSFLKCWVLSQFFFHSSSLSSKQSLVIFTFCHKGDVICMFEVIDISPGYLDSSLLFSLAFHMIYFAYKLNKQGDDIQPWPTPFPILNQSILPCPVLAVASWPVYRFVRSQVMWSGVSIF